MIASVTIETKLTRASIFFKKIKGLMIDGWMEEGVEVDCLSCLVKKI